MNLRKLNPFRKKSSITIGEKPIYQPGFFSGFGSSSVKWNEIYTSAQNNDLLIEYFNNIAEVAAPVLKYADGASQIIIKASIDEVQKLLETPNYYQGWNELFSEAILYKRLLGNSTVNIFAQTTLTGEGKKKPTSLYNLAFQYISIQLSKDDKRDFRDDDIKKYIFNSKEQNKKILEIKPENILHLKEVNPNFKGTQYLFGLSRYVGTSKNIEAIAEGYGAKVNLYKNGPRLFLTGKSQGDFSKVDTDEDIKDVQDKMAKYGWSSDKYNTLVTDVALDVTQASFNVGQLKINENNKADFDRICDAQGIDSKIFSKETKFEDKKAALSEFYNNAFRSEIDATIKDLQTKLREWWPELVLDIDYSQIAEIVAANNDENERLLADTEKGLMTRNDYLEATNKERVPIPSFDMYYTYDGKVWTNVEPIAPNIDNVNQGDIPQEQLEAQARLRGSVGGVQGILAIQASVASGTTDIESAVITLIEIYGFDETTARAILGTPDIIEDDSEEAKRFKNITVKKLILKYNIKPNSALEIMYKKQL